MDKAQLEGNVNSHLIFKQALIVMGGHAIVLAALLLHHTATVQPQHKEPMLVRTIPAASQQTTPIAPTSKIRERSKSRELKGRPKKTTATTNGSVRFDGELLQQISERLDALVTSV